MKQCLTKQIKINVTYILKMALNVIEALVFYLKRSHSSFIRAEFLDKSDHLYPIKQFSEHLWR